MKRSSKPPPHQPRGLGSAVSSSGGVSCGAPGKMWFLVHRGLKNQVISTFHSWLAVLSFRSYAKKSHFTIVGVHRPLQHPLNDAPGSFRHGVGTSVVELVVSVSVLSSTHARSSTFAGGWTASCNREASSRQRTRRSRTFQTRRRQAVAQKSRQQHSDNASDVVLFVQTPNLTNVVS